tara:strand:+ start:845 stop:1156 length:312 start_codon:yes stop_codon:yes gene_type:complete
MANKSKPPISKQKNINSNKPLDNRSNPQKNNGISKPQNKKEVSKEEQSSLSYAKNTPMLFIIGIFLFFVIFQYLKALKYKDNRLKQKIDAEIRKKLYYSNDYY